MSGVLEVPAKAVDSIEYFTFFFRNLAPVEGGERVLRSIFLPPFEKACVEAGALSIMTAYSILDGVPAVSNARKYRSKFTSHLKLSQGTLSDLLKEIVSF